MDTTDNRNFKKCKDCNAFGISKSQAYGTELFKCECRSPYFKGKAFALACPDFKVKNGNS